MSTKLQSLVVEIDGNVEALRRALREAGVELDTFGQKSDRAGKTSSTASDVVSSKSATAARQIAMVTETVARQGQVSGEAAKQMIAQASNVAFAFGPTGAIVGAIGIATLAITTMFARARREIEETARAARDEFRSLSQLDLGAVSRRLQQLDTGDFRLREALAGRNTRMTRDEALAYVKDDRTVLGEQGLLEERARLVARRDELERTAAAARAAAGASSATQSAAVLAAGSAGAGSESVARREIEAEIRALDAAMEQLRPRLKAARDLYQQRVAEAGDQAASQLSTVQAEAARKRGEQRLAEEKKFRDGLSQQSQAAQEALYARFQATLRDGFSGTRADIERSFAEMVQYAEEHGEQSEIAFLKRARQQAIDFINAVERSRDLLESLERSDLTERIGQTNSRDRSGAGETQLAAIERERDAWLAMANDATRSEQERTKYLGEAVKLQGLLEARLARTVRERRDDTKELRQQALVIGQAIDGVLQLAAAWGGVRAEVVNVLRGVVQMAANLPGLLDSLESLKRAREGGGKYTDAAGNVVTSAAAAANVAGTVLPIIGALSTIGAQLFGDSPAEQERKRVQRENTRAIERLTRQMSVNINVAGADWIRTRAELQELLGGEMRARSWTQLNADAFRRMGGRDGLEQLIARGSRFSLSEFSDSARIDWRQMGDIDRDLLEQTAKELDITLDGTVGSFRRLMDAIAAAEGKLFEFGDGYEDQVILTDLEIQAKRITDPLERTLAKLGPALENSPLLKDLIANADLSSEAGRAALRDSILRILETMDAGGDALDPEQVGLTRDQFLEVLGFLLGSLDDLDTQAAGAQGSSLGGVSGFRGLTEAAGERMADYLRGILGQGGEQLQVMRAQLAELARIAATPFTLPAIPGVTVPLPAGAAGVQVTIAAGALVMSGDIVVQVSGSTTDPAGLGLQVTQAVRDQVEELLYQSLSRALRVRGDVSIIPGVR